MTPPMTRRAALASLVALATPLLIGTAGCTPENASAAEDARGDGRVPYAALFRKYGRRHGVRPVLLAAVAKAESDFDPRAISRAGAKGLMQLMPDECRRFRVDPFDPAQAISAAARLYAEHLRRYHGDVDLAAAAYNAGPGAVHKYGGVPPYPETRGYIRRIRRYMRTLRV